MINTVKNYLREQPNSLDQSVNYIKKILTTITSSQTHVLKMQMYRVNGG